MNVLESMLNVLVYLECFWSIQYVLESMLNVLESMLNVLESMLNFSRVYDDYF